MLLAVFTGPSAVADEKDFLAALSGNWSGTGQIRLKPDAEPMTVSCTLDSRSSGTALNMDGACRAKVVFSRRLGADIQANGVRYTGSYIGSARGPAELSGTRSGDRLNLRVRWPSGASGPRVANMQIASLGSGRMRLLTLEKHPETGKQVVTARIDFSRK